MAEAAVLRTLNDFTYRILRSMLADLNDEQIHYSAPAIDERSIAQVAVHGLSGAYFLSQAIASGAMPDRALPEIRTRADLLTFVDQVHSQVDQTLANASAGALENMFTMPWGQQMAGGEALAGALAHCLVHAGNIQGIRAIGGFPTPPERR